jgi:hypothetical protein
VVIVLGVWFAAALSYVAVYAAMTAMGMHGPSPEPYGKAAFIVAFGILPIVQYAWTFFYLRLEDSEAAGTAGAGVVVPHVEGEGQGAWRGANAPKLRLVELARDEPGDDPPNP